MAETTRKLHFLLARVLRRRRSDDLPTKTSLTFEWFFIAAALLFAIAAIVLAIRAFR